MPSIHEIIADDKRTYDEIEAKNKSAAFNIFDEIHTNMSKRSLQLSEKKLLFHVGSISNTEGILDAPIFCSTSIRDHKKDVAWSQGKLSVRLRLTRPLILAVFPSDLTYPKDYAALLYEHKIKSDPVRSLAARDWGTKHKFDGWFRDISDGEVLIFKPRGILSVLTTSTISPT